MIERNLGSVWDVQQRCTSFFAFLVAGRRPKLSICLFLLISSKVLLSISCDERSAFEIFDKRAQLSEKASSSGSSKDPSRPKRAGARAL